MTTPKKTPRVRSAGILLHPSSLPGRFGIGDLGRSAQAWVEALALARQTWWQVLPLTPTGYADSPYQSLSAFAGNPNLISPEALVEDGLLNSADLAAADFPADRVDFDRVTLFKASLLERAWERFRSGAAPLLAPQFEQFCGQESQWLDDFALFTALKEAHGGVSWFEWSQEFVVREPAALASARRQLDDRIGLCRFSQFLFFRQCDELRRQANALGIRLIGDLPIFVASDSADVWANPEFFLLDEHRQPAAVAGVPPDYFSATGQLWGNPVYNWAALKQTGYAWWVARVRAALKQVDLVRLDHFRGFEAYWEVSAGLPTAEIGKWTKGPGVDFFEVLRAELGTLPLIAEDLGVITPEVDALRERFGLPGMCILQFAFGGAQENRFLPHNHQRNTVVYTGTHDNDTTCGWFASLTDEEVAFVEGYVPGVQGDPAWTLIRLAWQSVADLAIAPLQDILRLGSEARLNVPGQAAGNWNWRFRADLLTPALLEELAELTEVYERCPAGR